MSTGLIVHGRREGDPVDLVGRARDPRQQGPGTTRRPRRGPRPRPGRRGGWRSGRPAPARPRPGGPGGAAGAASNGRKIDSRCSAGMPGPASSTHSSAPVALGDPHPDGVPGRCTGGVGEQVLDDPLDLGRVGQDLGLGAARADRVGAEQLVAGLGDHAGDQTVQVDQPRRSSTMPRSSLSRSSRPVMMRSSLRALAMSRPRRSSVSASASRPRPR